MKYSDLEEYVGIIIEDNDPEHLGRVKCTIPGLFDTRHTPKDTIPWVYPRSNGGNQNSYVPPRLGQKVRVISNTKNYNEFWYEPMYELNNDVRNLIEGEQNGYVLLSTNSGQLKQQMFANETHGIVLSQNDSKIQLEPTGNVRIVGCEGSTGLLVENTQVKLGNVSQDGQQTILGDELETLLSGLSSALGKAGEKAQAVPYVIEIAQDLMDAAKAIDDALPKIKALNTIVN